MMEEGGGGREGEQGGERDEELGRGKEGRGRKEGMG